MREKGKETTSLDKKTTTQREKTVLKRGEGKRPFLIDNKFAQENSDEAQANRG